VIVQFVRRNSDYFDVALRKVGCATGDFA